MVNLGEEAIRAPFLLAAEEEADNMAVASTSVAGGALGPDDHSFRSP